MRKISNIKTAESAVTVILKKLSQLSRKRKSSQFQTGVIRQLLLGAKVDEVKR